MNVYKPTIGLEIHAELKTNTKMFCDSKNDPDEKKPNVNICPICMGHPGTLPVINKEAVKHVLKVGLALGGEIADAAEFDRKNYFYPDIPKGYQISQYKYPLVKGGCLHGVDITRIHLEEDTARSLHGSDDYSLIDFNRAGIPLMELVTEPTIKSARQATDFAKDLQLLLRYLGAGNANMEKGEMRIEANISLREIADSRGLNADSRGKGQRKSASSQRESAVMGTKVEIKNLNSFNAVEKAISYEIKRQREILEKGESVTQETRGWDENKQETFSQRAKEESHDYRYFPDPDLRPLKIPLISEFQKKDLKASLPELPWAKRMRYIALGIDEKTANAFVKNKFLADFFDLAADKLYKDRKDKKLIKIASNYIISDIVGLLRLDKEEMRIPKTITPRSFSSLVKMIDKKDISSRGAKNILAVLIREGGDPGEIAEKKGLFQKNDENELKIIAEKIIRENEKVSSDYRSGKESALQFLIGQGMKETNGGADPEMLKEIFKSVLKE